MVHYTAQPPPYSRSGLGLQLSAEAGPLCGHHSQAHLPMLSAQWRTQQPAGCGLVNLGNSCYLNSVLQCLAHLPPLANVSVAEERERKCRCPGSCVCCVLDRQVRNMLQPRGMQPIAPKQIHNNLHILSKSFTKGRQEDAHELLRCLVDAMERALLRHEVNHSPQKPPRQPRTLVNQIFGGILQNQVHCLACGHRSNTWDPCMDVSLELGGCSSVVEALKRFTAVERLDGDNKYRCEGCKQLVAANKQMTVYDDPNVLVIHLKRFDGVFGSKISRDVAFGTQLNLEPFISHTRRVQANGYISSSSSTNSSLSSTSLLNGVNGTSSSSGNSFYSSSSNGSQHSVSNGNNNNAGCSSNPVTGCKQQQQQQQQHVDVRTRRGEYVLHGVVIHSGYSAHSGHYYAYVRDWEGKWHCMNDSQVYRVAETTVLKQQAYILFYVRTSMKRMAQLPQHTESDSPRSPVAAGLKRHMSNGMSSAAAATAAAGPAPMIGPQLPPHLAKRQRVANDNSAEQQQQQQEPATVQQPHAAEPDMFADDEDATVLGPKLPPGWHKHEVPGSSKQAAAATPSAVNGVHHAVTPVQGVHSGQPSSPVAADAATANANDTGQYFAWARPPKQQQQQQEPPAQGEQQQQHGAQQQQPSPTAAAVQLVSSIKPELYADVQQHCSWQVPQCQQELRPWLEKLLSGAKRSGKSYEQCFKDLLPVWRTHSYFRSAAVQIMASWNPKLLSCDAAAAPAAKQ